MTVFFPRLMARVIVDLSHYQANVDFEEARADGVRAVILKATQGGSFVDDTFVDRAKAANEAGLLVGAYHFLDGSTISAQVAHFLGITTNLAPLLAIDVEPNGSNTATINQAAEAVQGVEAATGRKPLVYIGRYGPDGKGTGLPNAVLSACPLWLPQYGNNPICPPGWEKWTMWQFTDGDKGIDVPPVPGIGACDQSIFAGGLAMLRQFWAGAEFAV